MCDRRRTHRRQTADLSALVRPGQRVTVVDVSAGGALLQARRPLRPGADIEVQFERPDRRTRVAARVLRCGIAALDPDSGPTYLAAVAFNETLDWT